MGSHSPLMAAPNGNGTAAEFPLTQAPMRSKGCA